jgi:glycosyltransferase involved in cell wall biosynthesis
MARQARPDVVHFHNTFPLISPAAYAAASASGAAVVQSLHNYRLLCPGALLLREGKPCAECIGHRLPVAGVMHGCYHASRAQSAVVASMIAAHWTIGTWTRAVDVYVTLSEFARAQFIAGGLPAHRLHVKPNFVSEDPGPPPTMERAASFLYAGRLSSEKGVEDLLRAWAKCSTPGAALRVAGTGPLAAVVQQFASDNRGTPGAIVPLGQLGRAELQAEQHKARALVFPSVWYEPFGMTLIEAFACGTPAIASRIGGIPEIVEDGVTGLLHAPGDAGELAAKLDWATSHPEEMRAMGQRARTVFETRYSTAIAIERLMDVYRAAMGLAQARHKSTPS